MEPHWHQIYADIEDFLFPELNLDTWQRMVYHHLLAKTRMKGLNSGVFAIWPLSVALPVSHQKAGEVLNELEAKGCIRIEDRTRNGHLINVLLPAEIHSLSRLKLDAPSVDPASIDFFADRRHVAADFFADRRYVAVLLARENGICFYCLRRRTVRTCELDRLIPEKPDNSFRNVVASCPSCNKSKGSLNATDFLLERYRAGRLTEHELRNRLATLEAIQNGTVVPDVRNVTSIAGPRPMFYTTKRGRPPSTTS